LRSVIAKRRASLARRVERLPDAVVEGDQHLSLSVRKKKFGYYLDDHHGDGIVALACKAPPGMNSQLAADFPDRYYIPAYVGPRGWVALRLDLDDVDWDEVDELLLDAYRLTAPQRLVAQLG
jgi:hypothetical protein